MRQKFYLRVAKTRRGLKASISLKPNHAAMDTGGGYGNTYHPTVHFPIMLDIPDEAFVSAKKALELKITNAESAIEISESKEEEQKDSEV